MGVADGLGRVGAGQPRRQIAGIEGIPGGGGIAGLDARQVGDDAAGLGAAQMHRAAAGLDHHLPGAGAQIAGDGRRRVGIAEMGGFVIYVLVIVVVALRPAGLFAPRRES